VHLHEDGDYAQDTEDNDETEIPESDTTTSVGTTSPRDERLDGGGAKLPCQWEQCLRGPCDSLEAELLLLRAHIHRQVHLLVQQGSGRDKRGCVILFVRFVAAAMAASSFASGLTTCCYPSTRCLSRTSLDRSIAVHRGCQLPLDRTQSKICRVKLSSTTR